MGSLIQGVGTLLGGGNNNSNFQAAQGANTQQAGQAYDQTQQGIAAQQALMHALASQNGIGNQSDVYNQLQGVANGTGPNPAQAMLNQATGQNVANQAALMAGQRGAGANTGLIARQAGQQGGALQQQAAGQGATMQANQSLNALGQLGGIAGQQVAQQQGATQGLNAATQGQQSNILGGINAQNSTNGAIAQQNAKNSAGGIGGLFNGLGGALQPLVSGIGSGLGSLGSGIATAGSALGPGALMLAAEGGEVPNPKIAAVAPADRFKGGLSPQIEHMAKIYHPQKFADGGQAQPLSYNGGSKDEQQQRAQSAQNGVMKAAQDNPVSKAISWARDKMAEGGKVPAMVSPGEVYLPPAKLKEVAKGKSPIDVGEKIPGKPKVKGNSYANDTVPKKLESGGVVIPNSVMQSDDPVGNASEFVRKLMEKSPEHGDFKEALKKAISSRKA